MRKTDRGFTVFGEIQSKNGNRLVVQESSMAFEGAHAWLYYDSLKGKPGEQFSVDGAKELVAALTAFIEMAEADQLTEPAVWTKEAALRRGYSDDGLEGEDDE